MLDMIIKGGRVVTPAGMGNWDVGVVGEKIVAVAFPGILPAEAAWQRRSCRLTGVPLTITRFTPSSSIMLPLFSCDVQVGYDLPLGSRCDPDT